MYTLITILGVLALVCIGIAVLGLAVTLGMKILSWVVLTLVDIWEACCDRHDRP